MKKKDNLLKELRDFKISKTNLTEISGGKVNYKTTEWTCTQEPQGSDDFETTTDIVVVY